MAIEPYSSYYLDHYKNLAEPPEKSALYQGDPEEYLARLDDIKSPRARLLEFYASLFNFASPPTYEAKIVQQFTLMGTLSTAFVQGILKSPDIHLEYQMKHNASVFDSHYRGNRHFWDTLITGVARKSIRYGFRAFFFCSASSLTTTSSTIYRNKPHLVDHVAGFTAFGAVSRLWLGPRAVLVGGFIGSFVGAVIFGGLKAMELTMGMSLAQLKYLDEVKFTSDRELDLRKKMEMKEKDHMENLEEVPRRLF